MDPIFYIRGKSVTLTDHPARSATHREQFIASPKSAPVTVAASRCRHWLFVTLLIFLVACERPETEKTETADKPESAPAAKATANDSAAGPRFQAPGRVSAEKLRLATRRRAYREAF